MNDVCLQRLDQRAKFPIMHVNKHQPPLLSSSLACWMTRSLPYRGLELELGSEPGNMGSGDIR